VKKNIITETPIDHEQNSFWKRCSNTPDTSDYYPELRTPIQVEVQELIPQRLPSIKALLTPLHRLSPNMGSTGTTPTTTVRDKTVQMFFEFGLLLE